jgi:non-specific serine/threonine protein kinase
LFLGGEAIDAGELKKLLAEAEGLVLIKGKWVEVNRERLKIALKAYEQAQKLMDKTDLSLIEAIRFQLNAQKVLKMPEDTCELEVTNGQWLREVWEKPFRLSPFEISAQQEARKSTLNCIGLTNRHIW